MNTLKVFTNEEYIEEMGGVYVPEQTLGQVFCEDWLFVSPSTH